MSFKIHFFLSLFIIFCNADAFNITEILNKYPSYSTFNSYLTQTQVAGAINSRQTITVLTVSNDNVGPLSGKSGDVLAATMSLHVILDYYDVKKLQNLPNKTSILTTLYQTSGKANGQQGFLNVTVSSNGEVSFGSAVKGSNLEAKLVDSVTSQPYNISVLQVSSVIIPPSINNSTTTMNSTAPSSSPSPPPSPSLSHVPAASPRASPNPAPTLGTSPSTSPPPPPAPTPMSPAAPSQAPTPSQTPAPLDAPSNTSAPSLAPASDTPADSSLGTHLRHNLGVISVVALSTVCHLAVI